jgi:sec-independent protein translocase protein TatC
MIVDLSGRPFYWLLLAFVAPIWLSLVVSLGYWAAADATARGSSRPRLVALTTVIPPFGLHYYLFQRRKLGARQHPPSRRERLAMTWTAAGVTAFGLGAVVSPPDPFTQIRYFLGLFPVCLVLAYFTIISDR